MAGGASLKGIFASLIIAVGYSSFVMDIIQVRKVEVGEGTYPPAVIALMVASLLPPMFFIGFMITGGRGKPFTPRNVLIVNAVLAAFVFASVVAVTVLRVTDRYCGPANVIRSDCAGVLRGTMGLGWSLFGLQLVYAIWLPIFVRQNGTWDTQMWNMPEVRRPNADMEKAPAH